MNCEWCGRFCAPRAFPVMPLVHGDAPGELLLCATHAYLYERGFHWCHEEVADRNGIVEPCDRLAWAMCEPGDGTAYPVCGNHKEAR